jgi:hypothetical protein
MGVCGAYASGGLRDVICGLGPAVETACAEIASTVSLDAEEQSSSEHSSDVDYGDYQPRKKKKKRHHD